MLSVQNLTVTVNNKAIVYSVNLTVLGGEVCALIGPNGSGKSSLVNTIAGNPVYRITKGSILIDREDISDYSPDIRARKGIFVSFQQVPVISAVSVFFFLKNAYQRIRGFVVNLVEFRSLVMKYADVLGIDSSFLERPLFQGFSGGEKKRIEMLQLLLFNPKIAILDEIDSGVDVDSRKCIINSIEYIREHNPSMSIMFVTHYQDLIDQIKPDSVHIMKEGKIMASGNYFLGAQVIKRGYKEL